LLDILLVLIKITSCNTHKNQYWESSRALKILSAGCMSPAGRGGSRGGRLGRSPP